VVLRLALPFETLLGQDVDVPDDQKRSSGKRLYHRYRRGLGLLIADKWKVRYKDRRLELSVHKDVHRVSQYILLNIFTSHRY
jgi:hypothetical protein